MIHFEFHPMHRALMVLVVMYTLSCTGLASRSLSFSSSNHKTCVMYGAKRLFCNKSVLVSQLVARLAQMEDYNSNDVGSLNGNTSVKTKEVFRHVNHSLSCVPQNGDDTLCGTFLVMCNFTNYFNGTRKVDNGSDVSLSIPLQGSRECNVFVVETISTCLFPLVMSVDGYCVCSEDYVALQDGSCAPIAVYKKVESLVSGFNRIVLPVSTLDMGIKSTPTALPMSEQFSITASVQCVNGNVTACNVLVNLCVLFNYNEMSLPCRLHTKLMSDGTPGLLPLLYRSTDTSQQDAFSIIRELRIGQMLKLFARVYDWRGEYKGSRPLSTVFNLCRLAEEDMNSFFVMGSNRELSCSRSLSYDDGIAAEGSVEFFEIFLGDPLNATLSVPLPVLMDFSNDDFYPMNSRDLRVFTAQHGENLRNRFYIYNPFTNQSENAQNHVSMLQHVVLVFTAWQESKVTPLILLQYMSRKEKDTETATQDMKALSSITSVGVRVRFVADGDLVNGGLRITVIVICCISFLFSWVRTYSWMRRRQNLMLDGGAVLRFFIYLCNHIGNLFAIVVTLTSWYIFFVYRAQYETVNFVVSDKYVYLEAMIATATVTKGIYVIFKIFEQCNADYFVIDWERSKGQLLRENRILPVSMWRSTFVANELNELQVLRRWRPLLSMAIVLFFLTGLNYLRLAKSVPHEVGGNTVGAYSVTTLRIAVSTFFWFAVCLALYIIEYQFYYRFVRVHPLQAFVDLCSVSNISILVLPEEQWGYYVHGESIHAHSDVSMEEFQQNLHLEAQGNLPVRGLGGLSKCQTFEVFVSIYMRQYLYMCYAAIEAEHQKSTGKKPRSAVPGRSWHFFECILGFSRKSREYSTGTLAIKKRINSALQQSVWSAEGSLLLKSGLHRFLDLAPNILYMNGPQSGDKGGKDLFFVDEVHGYGNAFLYGIDFDIFVLYTMLYAAIDASLHNVYAAFVLTFAVEIVFYWYRTHEGLANIISKTLIDDRFFL